MLEYGNGVELLTLKDVGQMIKYKKNDSVKKWLMSYEIKIHHFGDRKNMVFKIDVDTILLMEKAREIRNQYPDNWNDILELYTEDKRVINLVKYKLSGDQEYLLPTSIVKPENEDEKKLFSEL